MQSLRLVLPLALALPSLNAQPGAVQAELTEVVSRHLDRTVTIPGELKPYRKVEIHARVTGFIEQVHVDRGAFVQEGQLLAEMSAPELAAQRAEALAQVPVVASRKLESQARLAAAESKFVRLTEASKTPGAVAGHDLVMAEKAVEAERALAESLDRTIAAHEAAVRSIEELERYLRVEAPFAGVVTERKAHEGTLAGPEGAAGVPLFTLEQVSSLRLVAAVPEAYRQSVARGRRVEFTVAGFPGEAFSAVVARPAYAVDPGTRTMPVELDVANPRTRLTPGMYAEVGWPIRRMQETLFVPATAVQATTERIFVIRVNAGQAEWVDVRRGVREAGAVEVFGDLASGDRVILRATDEIRPGMRVSPR